MRVLNRPMFRIGGSSKGTGVMSMVEPRENFNLGTTIENIRKLGTEYEQALRKSTQPTGGEKAALIAQIASTPGGLYEKITSTLPTQAQIFAQQRAMEPKILEAKMKQEATIAGLEAKATGTTSSKMKEFNTRRDFLIRQKQNEVGRDLTTKEILDITNQAQEETIAKMPKSVRAATPGTDKFFQMTEGATKTAEILETERNNINTYKNAALKKGITGTKYETNAKQFNAAVDKLAKIYNRIKLETGIDPVKDRGYELPIKLPETLKEAQAQNLIPTGKADGGRVMKAQGDIVTGAIEEQVDTTYGQPELKSFSYEELRGKLPPEVDNGIVKLLATSEDALRDFAYITTQQDINQFNQKYGVNLTLPVSG